MQIKIFSVYYQKVTIITILTLIVCITLSFFGWSSAQPSSPSSFRRATAKQPGTIPPFTMNDTSEPPGNSSGPSDSEKILFRTIHLLEQFSFSAEMKIEITLLGEQYLGKGIYKELRHRSTEVERNRFGLSPFTRSSFRLHFQLLPSGDQKPEFQEHQENTENVFEIIGNPEFVWTSISREDFHSLSKIEVEELARIMGRLSDHEQKQLMENGVREPCGISGFPYLGGLAGMLKSISAWYHFNPRPEKTLLNNGELEVWKIVGTMKSERLEGIVKQFGEIDERLKKEILQTIPNQVELYITDSSRLCRILYFYRPENKVEASHQFAKIDYLRFYLDNSLDISDFEYQATETFDWETVPYLKQLIPGIKL